MVEYLSSRLIEKGVEVEPYDISKVDLGELTMATVDAATIILAAPTILTNMHPMAELVAYWVSILRPKAKAYGSSVLTVGVAKLLKQSNHCLVA